MKHTIRIIALAALITSTAFGAMPDKLPEFKSPEQLAQWRGEMASKAQPSTHNTSEPHAFYTGKPYLAATGTYAFKYRSYNPELARWTSEDPSGFPDGANGSIYAPIPTCHVDFEGLWKVKLTSIVTSYRDRSGILSDMGIIYETRYELSYKFQATDTMVDGYAYATAQDYNRFTGTPSGTRRYGDGQGRVFVGLTGDGYLTANLPSGGANTETDVSGGISITGAGFDGSKRVGTITVETNAAYLGTVTYSASVGGLTYTPRADAVSKNTTQTFQYEVVE